MSASRREIYTNMESRGDGVGSGRKRIRLGEYGRTEFEAGKLRVGERVRSG